MKRARYVDALRPAWTSGAQFGRDQTSIPYLAWHTVALLAPEFLIGRTPAPCRVAAWAAGGG